MCTIILKWTLKLNIWNRQNLLLWDVLHCGHIIKELSLQVSLIFRNRKQWQPCLLRRRAVSLMKLCLYSRIAIQTGLSWEENCYIESVVHRIYVHFSATYDKTTSRRTVLHQMLLGYYSSIQHGIWTPCTSARIPLPVSRPPNPDHKTKIKWVFRPCSAGHRNRAISSEEEKSTVSS
jgi:hypothetical protein